MEPPKNAFFTLAAEALAECQAVELALKQYIWMAWDKIKECVGDQVPFKPALKHLDNASLSKLIEWFKTYSDNEGLAKDLHALGEQRNWLAHRALTASLDLDGGLVEEAATKGAEKLKKIQAEARDLEWRVRCEGVRFLF